VFAAHPKDEMPTHESALVSSNVDWAIGMNRDASPVLGADDVSPWSALQQVSKSRETKVDFAS
jgi:hypothetical protein